ncbi:hypothetical protein Tco_0994951, partial [Tanacetum coccineum]
ARHIEYLSGRDTKIPQSSGPPEKVGDEAVHKELGDRMERAATTASSLEAEQDSGQISSLKISEWYYNLAYSIEIVLSKILGLLNGRDLIRWETEVPQLSSPTQTHVADEAASTSMDDRHEGAANIVSGLEAGTRELKLVLLRESCRTKIQQGTRKAGLNRQSKDFTGTNLMKKRGQRIDVFMEKAILFEATVKRVNTFTPMESDDTVPKVVAGSSKRSAKEELGKESSMRQKIGDGSDSVEESKIHDIR